MAHHFIAATTRASFVAIPAVITAIAACAHTAADVPSVAPPRPKSFAGLWLASGYTCSDGSAPPEEQISIAEDRETLTATKVTGDRCVAAGEVTWRGVALGGFSPGHSFPVKVQFGDPGAPHRFIEVSLTVRNPDLLVLTWSTWTVTYRRMP